MTADRLTDQQSSILIIDDDESICKSLKLIFNRKGFAAETAASAAEALEMARARFYNIALLDIKLPDMEGVELLAPLKKLHPDMPVIITTAYASMATALRALNEGASAYLTKPLNMDEVLARISESLEKQALVLENRRLYEQAQREIMEREQAEAGLREASQKIIQQQALVTERERLKFELQLAGATAHELNQPLMGLVGNLELLKVHQNDPDKLVHHLTRLEEAGERISDIVGKIQSIRHTEVEEDPDTATTVGLEQELQILSVEGSVHDFEMVRSCLNNYPSVTLVRARDHGAGLAALQQDPFDIVLLDHVLPHADSLDFLRGMAERGMETPVVVVTGSGNELLASQVIQSGAYDYLPKQSVGAESLARSITNALEKSRLKQEIKLTIRKMREMATRDELTSLYNRRYFLETLEREVARARRFGSELMLCMADLDHFKQINDTYGHPAGDMVLSDISGILQESIRDSDLACRYGGEEFAVILPNTTPANARALCERFRRKVFEHRFAYDGTRFNITVSVGITTYISAADQTPAELVEIADHALYAAKHAGRNRIVEILQDSSLHRPKLGKILVSEGLITPLELEAALTEQKLPLGQLLVQAEHLTDQQLNEALAFQRRSSGTLGEILKRLGYSTSEQINWALKRRKRKLGEILQERGLLTEGELDQTLTIQATRSLSVGLN